MDTLIIGQTITCRITRQKATIKSVTGSFVELYDGYWKKTLFVSAEYVRRRYILIDVR